MNDTDACIIRVLFANLLTRVAKPIDVIVVQMDYLKTIAVKGQLRPN